MVRRSLRNRSLRKVFVKVAKGVKLHFENRPANLNSCANCKTALKGIKKMRGYKFKSISKSEKKVNRPYGGNLCSKCMREKIKNIVRENESRTVSS